VQKIDCVLTGCTDAYTIRTTSFIGPVDIKLSVPWVHIIPGPVPKCDTYKNIN